MAILIDKDGTQRLVYPANGITFSQEEINLYCNEMECILAGNDDEKNRENRPELMNRERNQ
jgi:hypothetical protein